MKRYIFVTFDVEGTHCYPQAGTDPALATGDWDDVSFLQYPHRHTFKFHVQIEVFHDDRDLEFIQEQRFMKRLYDSTIDIDHKSCEMLADELFVELVKRYDLTRNPRHIIITVSEDGENGSITHYGE